MIPDTWAQPDLKVWDRATTVMVTIPYRSIFSDSDKPAPLEVPKPKEQIEEANPDWGAWA